MIEQTENKEIDKIYCSKCKYFKKVPGFQWCKAKSRYLDDYLSVRKVFGVPKELNKNNACIYYEKKWWRII